MSGNNNEELTWITLDYEELLLPPVFLCASWSHPQWEPLIMYYGEKLEAGKRGMPDEVRYTFYRRFAIPPGMHAYRFRLGAGDNAWYMCSHLNRTMELADGVLYNILEVGLSPTPSEPSEEEENGPSSDQDHPMEDISNVTPNEFSEFSEEAESVDSVDSVSSSDGDFIIDDISNAPVVHSATRAALGEGRNTNFNGIFPQESRSACEISTSVNENAELTKGLQGWNTSQTTVIRVQRPPKEQSLPQDRGKLPSTSVQTLKAPGAISDGANGSGSSESPLLRDGEGIEPPGQEIVGSSKAVRLLVSIWQKLSAYIHSVLGKVRGTTRDDANQGVLTV